MQRLQATRWSGRSNPNIPKLTLEVLLDLMEQAGLVESVARKDIQSKETSLRARFLRNRYGPQAVKNSQSYAVSPTEIVEAAQLSHPEAKGRLVDEDVLAQLLSKATGLPYKKIDPLELDMGLITKALPKGFARRHVMLPLEMNEGMLVVALSDPFDTHALEEFALATGRQVQPVVSAKKDIVNIISQVYGFKQAVRGAAAESKGSTNLSNLEQLVHVRSSEEIDPADQNIVAAVEYLLNLAFDNRASDIHIEPKRDVSRLRLRIDGILHDIGEIPAGVHPAFIARVKILARMDIAEKRRPQDGRIKTQRGDREIELRVSSLPVAFGEKVVIRIFDPQVLLAEIVDLGFTQKERSLYESWISRPHGLVLVTGPTGSGKTTTLYSALQDLNKPATNIVTVEDPVEYQLQGINQVQTHAEVGLTFASGLRSILRQDPDVVMIGEIRDSETANIAVQAALTGHLVLSTLHTNDASGAIARLAYMGVEPFLIASSLVMAQAQRLYRKLCPACKQPADLPTEVLEANHIDPEFFRDATLYQKKGCPKCNQIGMKGRSALMEILLMNDEISQLILKNANAADIRTIAVRHGMLTLRDVGLSKASDGTTTIEEVLRVTSGH